jgi:hypothetical protein
MTRVLAGGRSHSAGSLGWRLQELSKRQPLLPRQSRPDSNPAKGATIYDDEVHEIGDEHVSGAGPPKHLPSCWRAYCRWARPSSLCPTPAVRPSPAWLLLTCLQASGIWLAPAATIEVRRRSAPCALLANTRSLGSPGASPAFVPAQAFAAQAFAWLPMSGSGSPQGVSLSTAWLLGLAPRLRRCRRRVVLRWWQPRSIVASAARSRRSPATTTVPRLPRAHGVPRRRCLSLARGVAVRRVEHDAVRGDVELADVGIVSGCAGLEHRHGTP